MLFEMPTGATSSVQVQEDRFEVYKVTDQRHSTTTEFQDVQKEIETKLLAQLREDAQKQVLDELRAKGNIITIFDGEKPAQKPVRNAENSP